MATYQNKGKKIRAIAHAIDPTFPERDDKINDEGEALDSIKSSIDRG